MYDADYEKASKAQIVDKTARFMKAHVALAMGDVYRTENLTEESIGEISTNTRHIELVEAIEEEIAERSVDFRIDDEDLEDLKSVRDAVDYVFSRLS